MRSRRSRKYIGRIAERDGLEEIPGVGIHIATNYGKSSIPAGSPISTG